jgi:deoxyribodipyrimidine photo-lyase
MVQHVKNLPDWMRPERTKVLKEGSQNGNAVYYWMQRDVRVQDNWALLLASHFAHQLDKPLRVFYVLPPPPPPLPTTESPPSMVDLPLTARYGQFLLGGLECVHHELAALNISLQVLQPKSSDTVGETVASLKDPAVIVCDFSPLRPYTNWIEQAVAHLDCAVYQVDAHNIVPVWTAATERQVGARTLRPRIHKVISHYLQEYPKMVGNKEAVPLPSFERKQYETFLQLDESVPAVSWAKPGTEAGIKQLEYFMENGLKKFDELRNDPNMNVCSDLSPWINHGHISFQTVTMKVKKLNKYANGTASFIEEGVIRRELSDNYVYYTPNYDSLAAAAGWAQETLQVHASDPREYVYTLEEFETAKTHDDLWNAAQLQVVREGRMHGFMRMYWAKKILEVRIARV